MVYTQQIPMQQMPQTIPVSGMTMNPYVQTVPQSLQNQYHQQVAAMNQLNMARTSAQFQYANQGLPLKQQATNMSYMNQQQQQHYVQKKDRPLANKKWGLLPQMKNICDKAKQEMIFLSTMRAELDRLKVYSGRRESTAPTVSVSPSVRQVQSLMSRHPYYASTVPALLLTTKSGGAYRALE
ncbi:hypothetical protein PCE1_003431 [Barthelona sp. PCE]